MPSMWKKINTKVILNHKRLTVLEDEVVLPNGDKSDYIYYKYSGNVATVVCEKENKILVQTEYSYVPNKIMYQFPGGFVPISEDTKDGAGRELSEESGLFPLDLKLVGSCYINHRKSESKLFVYTATIFKSVEQQLEDNEAGLKNLWLSYEEINELVKHDENLSEHFLTTWFMFTSRKSNG